MENIVRLSPHDAHNLADRLLNAVEGGHSVRIMTGTARWGTDAKERSYIKYDIGNTGWTPPIFGVDI